MFGGGGGFDPRKLQQMMNQMGIEVTEIDAEEIVIRTPDEELVFTDAQVQRMDAQGQGTYQIVGEPETRPRSDAKADPTDEEAGTVAGDEGGAVSGGEDGGEAGAESGGGAAIPDADVEIVAQRTGSSTEEARAALEDEDGDLAAAVARLE